MRRSSCMIPGTSQKASSWSARGFSLVELLVVIAIVSLLLSFIWPVARAVSQRVKDARCISNLRQVGAMVLAEAADFNGSVIPRYYIDDTGVALKNDVTDCWNSNLISKGYGQNYDVFYCPSFTPYSDANATKDIRKGWGQCFGMRDWRTQNGRKEEFNLRKKLSAIDTPSDFFLLGDSYWLSSDRQGYSLVPGAADKNSFVHFRHTGATANFFFADGSVRKVTREYIVEINKTQLAYGRNPGFQSWPLE